MQEKKEPGEPHLRRLLRKCPDCRVNGPCTESAGKVPQGSYPSCAAGGCREGKNSRRSFRNQRPCPGKPCPPGLRPIAWFTAWGETLTPSG
jgi:hypothetical protein